MINQLQRYFSRITLTQNCINRLKDICKPNEHLRIQVEPGEGCGGFSYHFEITQEITQEDKQDLLRVLNFEGAKVIFDEFTEQNIEGATIDFTDEMIRQSFVVLENPQADTTCGCGTSFSPKEFS